MKTKTPHERRRHAASISVVITGIITLGWLASLGYTASTSSPTTAQSGNTSQFANALTSAAQNMPHLEVSSTSVYSTQN